MPAKGAPLGTPDFTVAQTDELLDLLATVAYDHAQELAARSAGRWKSAARVRPHPETVARDPQLEWLVDRFEVRPTA